MGHDLYVLPSLFHVQAGATIRVAFHNGDSFPDSEVAPVIARLHDAKLVSAKGSEPVRNLHVAGKETLGDVVVPAGGSLQLAVATVPNLISLDAGKFLEYLKEEGLAEVIAWRVKHGETDKPGRERYTKFAKSLLNTDAGDSFFAQPLGFPIEILPLVNPSKLHRGDKLPVKVMFRGSAAAGFQIEAARAFNGNSQTTVIGRTGKDGRIDVPIDRAGQWRLHSLHMERCADPQAADWESFWASLTFEIH